MDADGQALYSIDVLMSLIRSKKRVADHGEVFTPPWLVEKMLDLVRGETDRIDARFLEPACGSGNFLVPILQRKLAAVELKYGRNSFEKRIFALQAVTCCYGIEILADNIAECRANMLAVFAEYLQLLPTDEFRRAASHVLSLNLIHGDALAMKAHDGSALTVVEWGYLGAGRFQRRDFRLDVLTGMAGFAEEGSLFNGLGRHEVFTPIGASPPMTVRELAAQDADPPPAGGGGSREAADGGGTPSPDRPRLHPGSALRADSPSPAGEGSGVSGGGAPRTAEGAA